MLHVTIPNQRFSNLVEKPTEGSRYSKKYSMLPRATCVSVYIQNIEHHTSSISPKAENSKNLVFAAYFNKFQQLYAPLLR